ncbi:SGNH/GDSL hydrolase family protein [Thioflexithrix psekupsensis]|uniref:SGNH hydrolase-type esterase domain-containing protein n=1 Tax=Thioflexithrix psekupsensis TaxID=1570016 RepID=A0A251X5L8_9GAMM|nr:SGNH/GDSL hydrolase family protein [Thioflexithrix psekupsensis]OUD12227.1 hypothetical protein TPSD3_13985 [Thioflexithrix psekupsensis]
MLEKLPLWLLHLIWWMGFILLFPLWYWQKRRIQPLNRILPYPAGATQGVFKGTYPIHTLVVLGESTAVGIGIATHAQGLAAQIAAHLNGYTKQAIHWQCLGGREINVQKTHHWLIPQVEPLKPDILVIVLGLNDTWQLTSLSRWREELYRVIHSAKDNVKQGIFFTLSPPFSQKKYAPQPLRFLLNIRRMLLNYHLEQSVIRQAKCAYIDFTHSPQSMDYWAEDGIHPSAAGYTLWGEHIARQILARLGRLK